MIEIYKYIYYNIYSSSAKYNVSPEIPVIGYVSFVQTNNILSLIYLFLFFTKCIKRFNLPIVYLIIQVVLFVINYYYFINCKKGDLILQNKKYSLGRLSFLTDVYLFLSVMLTGFTGYLFQEF
ncbi:hypothetical protein DM790_12150 [Flavobacterium collinsii]|nr:hypothetical protein [Flavobacterium collinsii]